MTREEAIEIEFQSAVGWVSHMPELEIRRAAAETIDCYVALGMIKLDEPKRLPQKLRDFVRDARLVQGGEMERLENLQAVLADAGLRIIEK